MLADTGMYLRPVTREPQLAILYVLDQKVSLQLQVGTVPG